MERLDRKVVDLTWENIRVGAICQKVMGFLTFRKIKKLQKVTFAFLHTCTAFMPDPGGPNRKSAKSCTFCTLALPNRPSRTFAYVYDVFARSGSPKSTFSIKSCKVAATVTIGGGASSVTSSTVGGEWGNVVLSRPACPAYPFTFDPIDERATQDQEEQEEGVQFEESFYTLSRTPSQGQILDSSPIDSNHSEEHLLLDQLGDTRWQYSPPSFLDYLEEEDDCWTV